jgi:hypothetical protein
MTREQHSTNPADVVVEEKPSPAVTKRIRALLRDIQAEDLGMVMFDVAQLSRVLSETPDHTGHPEGYEASVMICTERGEGMVGMCDGPDREGKCPWAEADGRVPCNSTWLATNGWMFKVADDAKACPVSVLDLARTH